MSRIVKTDFASFASKPKYILCFDISGTICTHAVEYMESRKREYCVGQWKIKCKGNA